MAALTKTTLRMTAAEFFRRPESNHIEELIDGELIVNPPIPLHQEISGNLYVLLRGLIPDGKVYAAPIGVYLDDDNVPEPDLVWVAKGSRCVIGDSHLTGAPDLIVEIYSPKTERRDRREKFALYQRFGVREYWMVDPDAAYVEVYTHDGTRFQRIGVFGGEESFDSVVLGRSVPLMSVFPGEETE